MKPFLSDRFMTEGVPTLRRRGLETRLGIDGQSISFARDGALLATVDVVVEWANRQPAGSTGTTRVIGTEGDLYGRVGELAAKAGDRFMIEGYPAEVTVTAKEVDDVMIAGFRMTTGAK